MHRIVLIFLSIFFSTATYGQSVADRGWDPILTEIPMDQRKTLSGTTAFEVPEVYELAMVVISLTAAGPDLTADSEYAKVVAQHFAPYAEHELIRRLGINSSKTDWFSAYEFRENAAAFCFDSENVDLIVRCKPYSHVWGRQANVFVRNIDLVADFARVSGFRAFYVEHKSLYEAEIQAWKDRVDVGAMKAWLEARFPVSEDHYGIVFSPLTNGWHSTQGYEDGDFAIRVMYLESVSDQPISDAYNAARIVFTEIDHSHVNAVAEQYRARLNSANAFGGNFWFKSENGVYDDGFRVFTEYMTWAVFELWARETYPEAMQTEITSSVASKMSLQRRFIHYADFRDALIKRYQIQTGVVDIAALYPDIIAWAEDFRAMNE